MESIAASAQMSLDFSPSRAEMERAFYGKDPNYDGAFFVAVRTTGIFCRPSCPSCPKPENIEFFNTIREAIAAGYRPCKRCHPMEAYGGLPDWVTSLMQKLEETPEIKITATQLRSWGFSPERVRRWFREQYGMTFVEWCRKRRLADAFTQIQAGIPLDDVVFENGYDSHSGFREAFNKTFGVAPKQIQTSDYLATEILETPVGPLFIGALSSGVCLIEYADRQKLEARYTALIKQFGCPVLPAKTVHIEQLQAELTGYFGGALTEFTVPMVVSGTAFQERVWAELTQIPYGQTISYDELAHRIGQPSAVRAVARANATNRISILIPCHRVIGKNGQLTGYAGGLWRKRSLLELERTGKLG